MWVDSQKFTWTVDTRLCLLRVIVISNAFLPTSPFLISTMRLARTPMPHLTSRSRRSFPVYLSFFDYYLRFIIHNFRGNALALYSTGRIMSLMMLRFALDRQFSALCLKLLQIWQTIFILLIALYCSFCFFPAAVSRMTWLITPLTDYGRFILITVIISLTIFSVMPWFRTYLTSNIISL